MENLAARIEMSLKEKQQLCCFSFKIGNCFEKYTSMKNHHSKKKKRKKRSVRFVIKLYVRGKNVNNLIDVFFLSQRNFAFFIIVCLLISVKSKVLL